MQTSVKIRDGHENFFTPIRLGLALAVLIGHAFSVIGGSPESEPNLAFGLGASYLAVNIFFIASGFLVTKSMMYRKDAADYSSARIMRIYPALIAHVLFVMFIIGPIATNLPLAKFFTDPQVLLQPLMVLTFTETSMTMPGMFENNAEPRASAALWTLRYEMLAYIGTLILFSLGLFRHRWMIVAQFMLTVLAWIGAHMTGLYEGLMPTLQALLRFGMAYTLGSVIYAYQDKMSFHILGLAVLSIVAWLNPVTAFNEIFMNLVLGYGLFFLAYQKMPKLTRLTRMSDISYGVYIYHWCVLQTIRHFWVDVSVAELIMTALPITLILSWASWHWVEKPMLARKNAFARKLRFKKVQPA